MPRNIIKIPAYLRPISIYVSNETPNTYVAVPTKISYILPSATTDMMSKNRKMKLAEVRAIIGRVIGTRNLDNLGVSIT